MGNSICGNDHCSNRVRLGSHAAIDMIKGVKVEDDGGYSQEWTVTYTTFESSCTLYLEKFVDARDRVREVFLELEDDICFGGGIRIWIERAQTNSLRVSYKCSRSFEDMMMVFKPNQTTNSQGSVVMTRVFCYGRRGKGGLVVVEWKKKSRDDEYAYKATVAHYYAISRGNIFSPNKIDIGLSMVVNIRASYKNLDFIVEGPVRHPSPALFYMFEQVSTSGKWNPMACPHCADTQRQRSGIYGQSDAESEGISNISLHGSRQNGTGDVLNSEIIRGNGNGNIIGKNFYF